MTLDYSQQLLGAAGGGDIEQLKVTIERGANLNTKDNEGRTAAMQAARFGYTECLALLIGAGADLDAKDDSGNTAAIWAIWKGHVECLALLIGAGVDLEAKSVSGWTAATWAVFMMREECLVLLIQAGMDPINTKEAFDGKNILKFAQDEGWDDVISAWEDQLMQKKIDQKTTVKESSGFGL